MEMQIILKMHILSLGVESIMEVTKTNKEKMPRRGFKN